MSSRAPHPAEQKLTFLAKKVYFGQIGHFYVSNRANSVSKWPWAQGRPGVASRTLRRPQNQVQPMGALLLISRIGPIARIKIAFLTRAQIPAAMAWNRKTFRGVRRSRLF